ncbi:QacE family quaternary ammonium compound efflux SMR transporter (plasmid) [Pseudomonas aeruginosa]|nr:quaternary ammonium compound efflux SMR transporter QacE [Pseudomonas aeruginosa]MDT8714832.1 QacE family quaternary ammonium compound efflux SMR transporter [Pseudomonas aeruginosa]
MKGWLFLVIAIVGEVIATSALKSSEGFTKLAPSAVVIIGYGIAFYFLSLVLKSIPVGVAYAVWSGLGVVIITAIAWLLHGQKLDAWGFVGMGLIIAAFAVGRVVAVLVPQCHPANACTDCPCESRSLVAASLR